jgi:hypothetical protein
VAAWVARGVRVAAGTRSADNGGKLAAVGTAADRRAVALSVVGRRRLSETDCVSTVALGRAQFGAQYRFTIIQTLLRFQNTK